MQRVLKLKKTSRSEALVDKKTHGMPSVVMCIIVEGPKNINRKTTLGNLGVS